MSFHEPLLHYRLLFEIVFALIIVSTSLIICRKVHTLYSLSRYRGIKYFSKAFQYFSVTFSVRFLLSLFETGTIKELPGALALFPLLFAFVMIYTATVGGLYLSYSLVWRHFERDCINVRGAFYGPKLIVRGIAFVVAAAEIFFKIKFQTSGVFLFLTVNLIAILFALIISYSKEEERLRYGTPHFFDPHFFTIVLAFMVFLVFFLGELFKNVYPVVSLYTLTIVSLIFLLTVGQIVKLTKH